MQQPLNLPPYHPYHIPLSTDRIRMRLPPPRHGARSPQHLLERVQIQRDRLLAYEELVALGASVIVPLFPVESGLVEIRDRLC